ncbi:CO(2)-response secreted protease-like [Camellia sinensis]|uniref:CO(2)-response secreted protease-like n=1 Tax=Camellia sinensis TaxID=4442 RepID=UPI0010365697|nr:CO(2)-response secreted protease-like [Camellia sinensis]
MVGDQPMKAGDSAIDNIKAIQCINSFATKAEAFKEELVHKTMKIAGFFFTLNNAEAKIKVLLDQAKVARRAQDQATEKAEATEAVGKVLRFEIKDAEEKTIKVKTELQEVLVAKEAEIKATDEKAFSKGQVAVCDTYKGHDEVVSIFPDPILQLHTTRSWDFLESESGIPSSHKYQHITSDVIIGVIDTGIWPESPSFNDDGIGEIPSRWKGLCMERPDFNKSSCNRKIIAARYYNIQDFSIQPNSDLKRTRHITGSPRDFNGHGTHTTSIAAGITVPNANYYGLAKGIARGGSPSARIASYKACSKDGCSGSVILKAIDDAIKDGVDIISISIGMNYQSDLLHDTIAIGAFHAEQMGVTVVCSGGNDGPSPFTVVNSAPWMFSVAASTIDRDFKSTIVLGNGKVVEGDKAEGLILIDEAEKDLPFNSGIFPFSEVGNIVGSQILNYINSTKNPTATTLPTTEIRKCTPAPVVAYFSSRGPGWLTQNILKPDIMAPGVAILAATMPNKEDGSVPIGKAPSLFDLRSGTWMACPHVSGAAAFIKSVHHRWSSSMIKSALMTTVILVEILVSCWVVFLNSPWQPIKIEAAFWLKASIKNFPFSIDDLAFKWNQIRLCS